MIFGTTTALKNKWISRIEQLLGVSVDPEAEISGYMCQMCKQRIVRLEDALTDLSAFTKMVEESEQALMRVGGSVKRTKQTSGDVGVSPCTARMRPSSKRSRKQLLFSCKRCGRMNIIIDDPLLKPLQGLLELNLLSLGCKLNCNMNS